MNLKEGTRRLALLLGVAGALGGSFVSYLEIDEIHRQRSSHKRFEQLAASDVVTQERKALLGGRADPLAGLGTPAGTQPSANPLSGLGTPVGAPAAPQGRESGGQVVLDSNSFIHVPSEVNMGGIKIINWAEKYGVYSIETEDGQTLYPTPSPAAWQYLFIALLPILGFLVPWGVIRAMGWVVAGFVQAST